MEQALSTFPEIYAVKVRTTRGQTDSEAVSLNAEESLVTKRKRTVLLWTKGVIQASMYEENQDSFDLFRRPQRKLTAKQS